MIARLTIRASHRGAEVDRSQPVVRKAGSSKGRCEIPTVRGLVAVDREKVGSLAPQPCAGCQAAIPAPPLLEAPGGTLVLSEGAIVSKRHLYRSRDHQSVLAPSRTPPGPNRAPRPAQYERPAVDSPPGRRGIQDGSSRTTRRDTPDDHRFPRLPQPHHPTTDTTVVTREELDATSDPGPCVVGARGPGGILVVNAVGVPVAQNCIVVPYRFSPALRECRVSSLDRSCRRTHPKLGLSFSEEWYR
jgi:hypothetical protein